MSEFSEVHLLPCPFCGGRPEIDNEPYWRISCEDDSCPAEATARSADSFKHASQIWNTRAPHSPQAVYLSSFTDAEIANEHHARALRFLGDQRIGVGVGGKFPA